MKRKTLPKDRAWPASAYSSTTAATTATAALRRVQGQALGGVGMLIARGGKNDYHAAMWAQGFGGPLGFGLLDSVTGNNHYYCGGMWRDSYPETPGYEGWGQGVGAGLQTGGRRRDRRYSRRRRPKHL